MKFIIGTSGFSYKHWQGVFYPENLPSNRWFEFYSQSFPTVELNSTFYHLPPEKAFLSWEKKTPENFLFALKASRLITHVKRLVQSEEPLQNFLNRAFLLKKKLGPILYQLPPSMTKDIERLKDFLVLLPKNLKHAFEFRHPSWLTEEVFSLLRSHNIAFCIYSMPGFSTPVLATADFAYVRFHGSQRLYSSCYTDEELSDWAEKIKGLSVSEVYIYFNNDTQGFALENGRTLAKLLG